MQKIRSLMFAASLALAATTAGAQVVHSETFDKAETSGWECNGNTLVFPDGNPGFYIGIPLYDTWGVVLGNTQNPAVLGDLTRYNGALEVSVDIRTFNLINFFGEQMPPDWFPVTLQLLDNSENPSGPASVYFTGGGLPAIENGWVRYTFTIPDPTSLTLPPGWGGTGDEDPVTFEPILPAGRTYRSVLENVVDIRITTFQPGHFYAASFWELGFDNVTVTVVPIGGGCPADWNDDGTVNSNDISAYLTAWLADVSGGTLVADFNNDGAVNSNDISAFLTAWLDAVQNGC